jgi:hypothetical protein
MRLNTRAAVLHKLAKHLKRVHLQSGELGDSGQSSRLLDRAGAFRYAESGVGADNLRRLLSLPHST